MPDSTSPVLERPNADHVPAPEPHSLLPLGLRRDWPAPRFDVLGTRDGFAARLECWAMLALVGGAARLPLALRRPLVAACARVARAVDPKHSEAARVFLRQALGAKLDPRELERRVLHAYEHLFHVTIEVEAFDRHVPVERIREHYTVEFCERARELLAARRGSILVTPHAGDWEAGSAILPWLGMDPLYVVSKPPKNKPLSVHFQRVRERRGVRLLPRRGAMRYARAVVDSGGVLVLMLDQRSNIKPLMAPFFGRMARCDRSAGVLMKRLRVPVMVGACFRTDRPFSYRPCIPTVIEPGELSGHTPEEIATRLNREMEQLILRHPEQYFWLHDRYRDAPESSAEEEEDSSDDASDTASESSAR
jgi:KDO2-lipid IV(A) lauroyltransferase